MKVEKVTMVYKELIPVVATGVTFVPELVLNENRKGPYDVFNGRASFHFNDWFKRNRLNGTYIDTAVFGDCHSNNTCKGALEILRTGQADFSVFPLLADLPNEFNLQYNNPFLFSKLMAEYMVKYIAGPYKQAYTVDSEILITFEETYWLVNFLQLLLTFFIFIMLNVSVKSRYNYLVLKGEIKLKVKPIEIYGMYMRQFEKSFRTLHRSITLLVLFIHCAFSVAIISGSISSNLVSEYPAKYYSSLEEVIENVKEKSDILILRGMSVHSKLIHRKNTPFYKLGPVADLIEKQQFAKLYLLLSNGSTLVAAEEIIHITRALFCTMVQFNKNVDKNQEKKYFSFRDSNPLYLTHSYLGLKANVSTVIKLRLERYASSLTESGIHKYYFEEKVTRDTTMSLTGVGPAVVSRCELNRLMMKWPSVGFLNFSLIHFTKFFTYFLFSLIFSFIIFVFEVNKEIFSFSKCSHRNKKLL